MELIANVFSHILQGIGLLIALGIGVFVIVILFGDEVHWNFQITGDCEAFKRNKVKIKLKNTRKKGKFVIIRHKLKPEHQHKELTLLLNGTLIATIDKHHNSASTDTFNIPITIEKPEKGQILTLKIDNKEMVSGRLS